MQNSFRMNLWLNRTIYDYSYWVLPPPLCPHFLSYPLAWYNLVYYSWIVFIMQSSFKISIECLIKLCSIPSLFSSFFFSKIEKRWWNYWLQASNTFSTHLSYKVDSSLPSPSLFFLGIVLIFINSIWWIVIFTWCY
jgi:hypothetical protein